VLFRSNSNERHPDAFGQGIYSDELSRRTYAKALELAMEQLHHGRSVIIDASYKRREERLRAAEAAKTGNAGFFVIECVAPEWIVKERLDVRQAAGTDPSDGRWELYIAQKADFDPVTEFQGATHIVQDTTRAPGECLEEAIWKIRGFVLPEASQVAQEPGAG
jgi:predicted kinase